MTLPDLYNYSIEVLPNKEEFRRISMAVVDPLPEEQIERALLKQIQFFKGPLGVIPNSVRTMARKPHLVKAFTKLNKAGEKYLQNTGWSVGKHL